MSKNWPCQQPHSLESFLQPFEEEQIFESGDLTLSGAPHWSITSAVSLADHLISVLKTDKSHGLFLQLESPFNKSPQIVKHYARQKGLYTIPALVSDFSRIITYG